MNTDKALSVFQFQTNDLRVIVDDDGNPWFVAADVCAVLDLGNVSQALSRLEEDEKDNITSNDVMGRRTQLAVVNEFGLYSLTFTSRKPEGKALKKLVTHEILPSIRKTGGYLAKPMTALELLELNLAATKAHEARLAEQDARIQRIEAVVSTKGTQHMSIKGYCRYARFPSPSRDTANRLGRLCAKYSRENGYDIQDVTDDVHGTVHAYDLEVLAAIVDAFYGKGR